MENFTNLEHYFGSDEGSMMHDTDFELGMMKTIDQEPLSEAEKRPPQFLRTTLQFLMKALVFWTIC